MICMQTAAGQLCCLDGQAFRSEPGFGRRRLWRGRSRFGRACRMPDSKGQLKLFRLLVEHSLGLMCIHDLDGVLLLINPAAAQALGYTPEECLGRSIRDLLVPAVQPRFDAYLSRIRVNPSDSGLMRLRAKDGTER